MVTPRFQFERGRPHKLIMKLLHVSSKLVRCQKNINLNGIWTLYFQPIFCKDSHYVIRAIS